MDTKIAAFLLVLLNIITASVHAAKVEVLNINNSGANISVEMQIEHSGKFQVKLRIKNKTNIPVSFNASIDDLSESQFMDFPTAGALQLRASGKMSLNIGGEMPDGWWYPNMLNSVMVNPKFSQHGSKPAPTLDDDLKPCALPPRGEKFITIYYRKVLNMTNARLASRQPSHKAESCRIGINIRVIGVEGGKNYFIISDWFDIRDAS